MAEWWIRRAREPQDWTGAQTCSDAAPAAPKLTIDVPTGFTEMLSSKPDLALEWRMKTRKMFTSAFACGYRAVDFRLDVVNAKGTYLLERT